MGKAETVLVRFGELSTKGKNKKQFVKKLRENLKEQLKDHPKVQIHDQYDRLMIQLNGEDDGEVIEKASKVFGIRSLSPVYLTENTLDAMAEEVLRQVKDLPATSFKVISRRKDKRLPYLSDDVNRAVASRILKETKHTVDVHQPELQIRIDCDINQSSIALKTILGAQGYPVGIGGKGLLLLSGGIDSPVAAYLTMKRGVSLECIHFAAPPYTTPQALDKVKQLVEKLNDYQAKIRLHVVEFTPIQLEIYKKADKRYAIQLMRRMMMRIAEKVMDEVNALALVTGENLGQVASQTLESMRGVQDATSALILRPLLSYEKNEIIDLARKIGSYEISILPYEDCCTIFDTSNPIIKPKLEDIYAEEEKLEMGTLLDEAIQSRQILDIQSVQDDYL